MICSTYTLKEIQDTLERIASQQSIPITKIMAVSKGQPIEKIEPLLREGHRFFGESRVQEALKKWPTLKEKYPDIVLHLIGPLQTNKVKDAVKLFDRIETLDRPTLANSFHKTFQEMGIQRDLLIQVNTSLEPQKTGIFPDELGKFYSYCKNLDLPVKGLMCVPEIDKDPSSDFGYLQRAAKKYDLPYLSMGMSQDYEIAASYETSWVRIGRKLFGES